MMRSGILPLLMALLLPVGTIAAAQSLAERNAFAMEMKEIDEGVLTGSKLDQALIDAEKHPLETKENPVRADMPAGQRAYIGRLRCSDGSRPQVGARFNVGVGPFGTIVDVYPLQCKDGPSVPLHMDMYFRHVEDRAPPGFSIQSLLPTV